MSVNRAVYIPPYMNETPFFPTWRPRLAAMGARLQNTLTAVKGLTLAQLEKRFASVIPSDLFPKALNKANSRDRIYTPERTFYGFLWQCLNRMTSCRQVVRQVQALFVLHDGPPVSEEDGAYCRARKRLPVQGLTEVVDATAQHCERSAPRTQFLQGRKAKVVDGTCLTLADTHANLA